MGSLSATRGLAPGGAEAGPGIGFRAGAVRVGGGRRSSHGEEERGGAAGCRGEGGGGGGGGGGGH